MGVTSALDVSLLAAIADGLAERVAAARQQIRDSVANDWRATVAVRTGALRGSIATDEPDANTSTTYSGIGYAGFHEFGTRYTRPGFELTTAVERHRAEYAEALAGAWLP